MEQIQGFLSDHWQYLTLILGAGLVVFGIVCNKIKLPGFLDKNPGAKYSLGLRIVYISAGIGTVAYSLLFT